MYRLLLSLLVCLFVINPALAQKPKETPTATASGQININTATLEELKKLNGVGDVTAKKILEYREANGPFKSVDDLSKVNGIGPKTLDKFRSQVSLGGGALPTTEKPAIPTETTKSPTPTVSPTAGVQTANPSAKINVNTATIPELKNLVGVGDITATNIFEYRKANGPFKSIDDLTNVKGVSFKALDGFRAQVLLEGKSIIPAVAPSATPVVTAPTNITPTNTTPTPAATASGQININTATLEELKKLNGVGDVTAKKILEYREANGPFKSVDDLSKVNGVGPKTLDKFRSQVSLGGVSAAAVTPAEKPAANTPTPTATPAATGSQININTASIEELKKLNGVGDVTAKKIIEYREANGPFKSVDDLSKVNGIGPKTLDKFKAQATIGGSTSVAPVVPSNATPVPTEAVKPVAAGALVNINTADVKGLGALPGVGDATAQRIIEYRQANGPFKSCKDLNNVKGIGDKTLEKMLPTCTVQ